MSEFTEKLKEPFEEQLNYQLSRLNSAMDEIEAQREIVGQWPARKKRIVNGILSPIQKWSAMLKNMTRPLDVRPYKREKKRLLRAKSLTWFHWRGFMAKSQLTVLRIANIVRILLIMGFSIGTILLVGYLIVKVFGLIGGVG
jgi:hypothetical protein